MDGRFLTAFILPKEWDIIGYKLKPYSLRHSLYLTALESPFITGKMDKLSPEDILVFLRICSSEHPSNAFRKPSLRDYWRIGRMQADIGYFYEIVKDIMVYIHDCCSAPVFYKKEKEQNEKQKENIPNPLAVATSLIGRLNLPMEEAWNMPVGQAIWYATAYSVAEGAQIKVLSTEDEQKADFEKNFLVKLREEQQLAKNKKKGEQK
jgi:hypothetical protein